MNEEQKNMDTCLAENILSEVALVLTILCCVFFGRCKTVAPCVAGTNTHDSVYVYVENTDTIVVVETDSASIGLYDEETAARKIDAYKAFLKARAELKAMVEADCKEEVIR